MLFISHEWDNPLGELRADGIVIVYDDLPLELSDLQLGDAKYLCRLMTHSNVYRKPVTKLCFEHLDGNVSMYESSKSLSSMDGV